jgi:holo-[acyl-carrier protein] synthase
MIIGIGVDVIEVNRMRRAVEQHGSGFLQHVFTDAERHEAPAGAGKAAYFASRWAAKEAVAKALGTGIGAACAWTDVEVVHDRGGRPAVRLSGRAAETAHALGVGHIHLSISHERRIACASAVAEKVDGTAAPPEPAASPAMP